MVSRRDEMKGKVGVVLGLFFLVTAGAVYLWLSYGDVPVYTGGTGIVGDDPSQYKRLDEDSSKTVRTVVKYSVSGFFGVMGGLFLLFGLRGKARGPKIDKRQMVIMQTGIGAQGTVTFVGRNDAMLVNNVPMYSIVEYSYQDTNGATHTRRIDNVSDEIIAMKQIHVGAKIPIKYSRENPAESVIVLI